MPETVAGPAVSVADGRRSARAALALTAWLECRSVLVLIVRTTSAALFGVAGRHPA